MLSINAQRARDALAFDPLPPSKWIETTDAAIRVRTLYSEPLSRLLRSLPDAKWRAEERCWEIPFERAAALRVALPEIDRLAALAKASADKETERRERAREEAAASRRVEMSAASRRWAESRPRSLRPEYLTAIPARPVYSKILEAVGDDIAQKYSAFGFRPRQWIGQILGIGARDKWARAYLSGARDYAKSNSVGSRGIKVTYLLDEGLIYEVSDPRSWSSTDRYFVRIMDGVEDRMAESEVKECLAK